MKPPCIWRIGAILRSCHTMTRIYPDYFYELGKAFHVLVTCEPGECLSSACGRFLYEVQQRLHYILTQNVAPLRICIDDGWALWHKVKEINDRHIVKGEDSALTDLEVYNLKSLFTKFETVMTAEMHQLATYAVIQKGCYSTPHLIDEAELIFTEQMRNHLPSQSITDIRQGGRCLAFEVPTAAAFHFLRATEAVLHRYYEELSGGHKRPRIRNMGKYIEALEKISSVDKKVLAVLRQLKDLHRNPIMHPEISLDMDEAMTLLGIVQSAITTMVGVVIKQLPQSLAPADPFADQMPVS